ncbi:MAG: TIGR01777 family oxidoreductase, partial [Sporichthyaceae bacterium]|nr:TIGR01777 family oxidoreductase [Sporichthyaceae bacterium]
MRIAVTGASGLIGTALTKSLVADGHEVRRLVRREARGPDEVSWDPVAGTVDLAGLAGLDVVVHLAGAPIGRPWTKSYQQTIMDSRVNGTRTIARAVTALDPPPRVLVSASGVHYYSGRDAEPCDESSLPGEGFLTDVVLAWEAAAEPAREAGIRVVHPRNGVVVSQRGGAFQPLIRVFRLGLGGRMGSGRQYWSWVALEDTVRAYRFVIDRADLAGPVNVTGPNPVTNAEVTRALGAALHRPAVLPIPGFAMRLVLRGMA